MIKNSSEIRRAVGILLEVEKQLDVAVDAIDTALPHGEELADKRELLWKADRLMREAEDYVDQCIFDGRYALGELSPLLPPANHREQRA